MNQINKLKENTICIICAKSNSEGVSSKNIKKINGYPLINYAFKKIKTNNFKFICVSTQSDKVVKLAKENNIKVFFKRSEVLCKKNVSVRKKTLDHFFWLDEGLLRWHRFLKN